MTASTLLQKNWSVSTFCQKWIHCYKGWDSVGKYEKGELAFGNKVLVVENPFSRLFFTLYFSMLWQKTVGLKWDITTEHTPKCRASKAITERWWSYWQFLEKGKADDFNFENEIYSWLMMTYSIHKHGKMEDKVDSFLVQNQMVVPKSTHSIGRSWKYSRLGIRRINKSCLV